MANFGIGLGAFMNGMSQGMQTYSNLQDAKDRREIRAIQLKQLKQDDADKQALRDVNTQGAEDAKAARAADVAKAVEVGSAPSADGTKTIPTFSVGGKSYKTQEEANAAADKQVGSFMEYYMKTTVPKMQEHWLKTGQTDKAEALGKWLENEDVKKGAKAWAGAVRSFQLGDRDGFKKNLMAAYNQQGYFDDGTKAVSIDDVKNDKGALVGYSIKFRNADGTERVQQYDGNDVGRMALNALSPTEVLSYGMDQLKQAAATRAELAKEGRAEARDMRKLEVQQGNTLEGQANQSQLRMAEEAQKQRLGISTKSDPVAKANAMAGALKASGWSDEKIKAEMPRLLGVYRQSQSPADRLASTIEMLAKADLNFAGLPDGEKVAKAKSLMDAQDSILSQSEGARTPAASAAPATPAPRGIPVWDNKTNTLIYR